MSEKQELPKGLDRIGKLGPGLFIVGLLLTLGGLSMIGFQHAMKFYLYAWIIGMGYSLGCYGMMLLQNTVWGSWGYSVIRFWEAGARLLPIMGLLFLPIWYFAPQLYPWAQPVITNLTVQYRAHKIGYLNSGWILIRAIVYFTIWTGSTYYLSSLSRRQDVDPDPALVRARTNFSSFGLVVFALTVNFAYTDWVMALENRWYSTIFGLWFVVSQGLCGVGLVAVLTMLLRKSPPYSEEVDKGVRRDLGNLLLTLTMFWGYFSFSQWVIVWSGNLPDEIDYYLHRFSDGWLYIGAFIIVFQFFGPFLALLSGKTKNYPFLLGPLAAWILFMRLIDIGWTIFPSFEEFRPHPEYLLIGLAAAVAMMGLWITLFVWQLRGARLITHPVETTGEEVLHHA